MTQRIKSILHLALWGTVILGMAGLTACSSNKPETTLQTILIPAQWTIVAHDSAVAYDFVGTMAADAGLKWDMGNSFKVNGTWTSQKLRCSPNGDERHTAMCIFHFAVNPVPDFNAPPAPQVTLNLKVEVPERVPYDKDAALQQIRIEPLLDSFANKLAVKFGAAQVSQNTQLSF